MTAARGELPLVLIVGGGELGTAVAHRLSRCGMPVVVTEVSRPSCIRRKVCFATAVTEEAIEVEGVNARRHESARAALDAAAPGTVAVLVGEYRQLARQLKPSVVVDARMLKTGEDISPDAAPLVVGLGPGFAAGGNVHVVVETNRGHDLGRVIYRGRAENDTGVPAPVEGLARERVIWAPRSGRFTSRAELGAVVEPGDVVGDVDGYDVTAPIGGLLRGLVESGTSLKQGKKMGDIDPRGAAIDVATISDKGRAVAGGVLEAVLHWWYG